MNLTFSSMAHDKKTTTTAAVLCIIDMLCDNRAQLDLINELMAMNETNVSHVAGLVAAMEGRKRKRKARSVTKSARRENYIARVATYTDIDFRAHFRLSRSTVQILMEKLPDTSVAVMGRPPINMQTKVLLAIWCLANEESFRAISERFGVGRGHANTVFLAFCKDMGQLSSWLIKWPSGAGGEEVVQKFNRLHPPHRNFPNVIGCVGGTHIQIAKPKHDHANYCNKKQYHSVVLMAVCDSELRYRYVCAGLPGSSSNGLIWRQSELGQALMDEEKRDHLVPPEVHLLGDRTFPLNSYLLTPYRDNSHLARKHKQYNMRQAATRTVIDCSFAHLRGRFRRLRLLNMRKIEKSGSVILACCLLHNLCINEKDPTPEVFEEEYGDDEERETHNSRETAMKRNSICEMFFEEELSQQNSSINYHAHFAGT